MTLATSSRFSHCLNSSDEIAYCMEKSYKQVSRTEAARILYLKSSTELAEIVQKVSQPIVRIPLMINSSLLARLETRIGQRVSLC